MAKGDRTRAILERIVGTKSKADLADKFKEAFAEKYGLKKEEIKKGIVDKVNSKKVEISFFDEDDDGVVDDPELFDVLVDEDTNPLTKYVFQQKFLTSDGVEDYNYVSNDILKIIVLESKDNLGALSQYDDQQIFYYVDTELFEKLNSASSLLERQDNYRAFVGRDSLRFLYIHAADDNTRIDPSASNIIDSYLLTRAYDTQFRKWLDGSLQQKPLTPSSDNLFQNYGTPLNEIKSLSDEIIYHPVKYKVLFGTKASLDLQAKFKVVKNPDLVLNNNDIKSRIISAINQFFALENWDFGEKFYFSELSTYVMQQLAPDIVTFVIVPDQVAQTFGSLYEIKAEVDEIFISGAIF